MATVNLGSIKFNWKGTYVGATAYKIDDVVEYNGSSYISIQAGTGNLPTDTAYWELMSQKGTNGTDGTDLTSTLTTQGDILYRDASGLQRLGAGTSGQALITNGTGANPSWGDVSGTVLGVATGQSTGNVGISNDGSTNYIYGDIVGGSLTYTPQSTSSKIIFTLNSGMGGIGNSTDTGYGLVIDIAQSGGINVSANRKSDYGYYHGSGSGFNYGNDFTTMRVYNNTSTNQITVTGKGYTYSEGSSVTFNFGKATLIIMEVE
jgi:hypothetical protein